jgi:hypothetical protein
LSPLLDDTVKRNVCETLPLNGTGCIVPAEHPAPTRQPEALWPESVESTTTPNWLLAAFARGTDARARPKAMNVAAAAQRG